MSCTNLKTLMQNQKRYIQLTNFTSFMQGLDLSIQMKLQSSTVVLTEIRIIWIIMLSGYASVGYKLVTVKEIQTSHNNYVNNTKLNKEAWVSQNHYQLGCTSHLLGRFLLEGNVSTESISPSSGSLSVPDSSLIHP